MTLALFGAHRAHHHLVGLAPLIVLLLIVLLIWLAVSRSRRGQWRKGQGAPSATRDVAVHDNIANSTAERTLSERFAKGELNLDEYRAALVALRELSGGSTTKS